MVNAGQTVDELYTVITHCLSLTERLKLATLLLNDLAQLNVAVIDQSSSWSEADQQDVTVLALDYAAAVFSNAEMQ